MRVKRLCGHVDTLTALTLCPACLGAARGGLCAACEGYRKPLPPCPLPVSCREVYDWDEKGEHVTIACGYCGMHTAVWASPKIPVGRWLRREREIGTDQDGKPIVERKSLPIIKSVPACPACAETWSTWQALWRMAGKRGPCFLPLP